MDLNYSKLKICYINFYHTDKVNKQSVSECVVSRCPSFILLVTYCKEGIEIMMNAIFINWIFDGVFFKSCG